MPQQGIISDYFTNTPQPTLDFKDAENHFWNDTHRNFSSLPEFNQKGQVTFLSILFVSIMLTNSVVLTTLGFSKKKSRMNFFILHLAIADLSVGIFSVFPDLIWKVTISWHAGNLMCKVVRYLQAVAIYASNYVLVALSLDRLDAIARPLNFTRSGARPKMLIAGSWLMGSLFSLPMLCLNRDTPLPNEPGVSQCILHLNEMWHWQLYLSLIAAALLFIPAIIIIICYAALVHVIWQAGKRSPEQRVYRQSSSSPNTLSTQGQSFFKYCNKFSYRNSSLDRMLNNASENRNVSNKNNYIQMRVGGRQNSKIQTNNHEPIKSSTNKEQFDENNTKPAVNNLSIKDSAAEAAVRGGAILAADEAAEVTADAKAHKAVLVALSCHVNQTSDTPNNRTDAQNTVKNNQTLTESEETGLDESSPSKSTLSLNQIKESSVADNSRRIDAVCDRKDTQQLIENEIKSCDEIVNTNEEKLSQDCSKSSCDRCRNNRKFPSCLKLNNEGGAKIGARESDWSIRNIFKTRTNEMSQSQRQTDSMIANPSQGQDSEKDIILGGESTRTSGSFTKYRWAQQSKTNSQGGFSAQQSVNSSKGLIPKAKIKTVKMSFVIVLAFIFCWTPYFVYNLLDVFQLIPESKHKYSVGVFIQSLATLNSVANPLIYGFFYSSLSWCLSASRRRFVGMRQSFRCFNKTESTSRTTGSCTARINLHTIDSLGTKSPGPKSPCPANLNKI